MKPTVKKILKFVVYFHVILLVALLLTHCTFTRYAKKSYQQAKKDKPYDVIIVPGVPYETGSMSKVMTLRIFWAKHLYDSGFTKNIIFSGSSVYSPYIEGVVMKVIADSLGIPSDHTFSETKAEHSTENIYYSWKMAKKMGFRKIALATDPYQAGLLRSFIREYCSGMKSVPAVFDVMKTDQVLPAIDPTSAYVKDFVSIMKREGFWERFSGTRGRRVKEEVAAEEKARKNKNNEIVGE